MKRTKTSVLYHMALNKNACGTLLSQRNTPFTWNSIVITASKSSITTSVDSTKFTSWRATTDQIKKELKKLPDFVDHEKMVSLGTVPVKSTHQWECLFGTHPTIQKATKLQLLGTLINPRMAWRASNFAGGQCQIWSELRIHVSSHRWSTWFVSWNEVPHPVVFPQDFNRIPSVITII